MWHARRSYDAIQPRSLQILFRCWRHMCTYSILHKCICLLSRQNKRQHSDDFMKESADLVLRYEILDWHRCIHQINSMQ